MDADRLREKFTLAGQGQVFQFYDSLTTDQKQRLLEQLESVDVDRCNAIFERATRDQSNAHGDRTSVSPLPPHVVDSISTASSDQRLKWNTAGLKAVSENTVAVILLAGGQGTRLGSSAPKGCYDIGLPSSKSLFQMQAERILAVQRLSKTGEIRWYVMTSGPTRKPTEDFFALNKFFGMKQEQIFFFEQGKSLI